MGAMRLTASPPSRRPLRAGAPLALYDVKGDREREMLAGDGGEANESHEDSEHDPVRTAPQ